MTVHKILEPTSNYFKDLNEEHLSTSLAEEMTDSSCQKYVNISFVPDRVATT